MSVMFLHMAREMVVFARSESFLIISATFAPLMMVRLVWAEHPRNARICSVNVLAPAAAALPDDGAGRLFRQGVVTNLLNPKVGLFFISFLPQFVTPGAGTVADFVLLGLTFVGIGIAFCSSLSVVGTSSDTVTI